MIFEIYKNRVTTFIYTETRIHCDCYNFTFPVRMELNSPLKKTLCIELYVLNTIFLYLQRLYEVFL